MKICFFTPAFPGKHNTTDFAFVKQLVDAIASKGNECHVIAPYNLFHYRKFSVNYEEYSYGNGRVVVYRPYYFSMSHIRGLQWINTSSFRWAISRATRKLPNDIDCVYGHFWSSGYEGYKFAKAKNLPLFVATGESSIKELFHIPEDLDAFREYVSGVICVSGKNRDESIDLGLTSFEKCIVLPNGVNSDLFHIMDKGACREELGLPSDSFIAIFVGWFNHRKGSRRVSNAINKIKDVDSIFIGRPDSLKSSLSGNNEFDPQCDGILFKGEVSHDRIPLYLSAADCFVLPTIREGCCNAVVEALACGLPVISSNLSFNLDVLDDTNSIMIDPLDIDQIANAIRVLHENKGLREQLSIGALNKAEQLSIDKRADSIISFMMSIIY